TMVWTYHHILLDARSLGLVLNELFVIYESLRGGGAAALAAPRPYSSYIEWLQQQDWGKAENFWRERLKGFTAATPLIAASASTQSLRSVGEKEIAVSEGVTLALRAIAQK